MELKEKTRFGIRWTSTSTFFVIVVHFSTLFYLAKLIGPHEFSMVGIVLLFNGFGQLIMDMGVSSAIIAYQTCTKEELSSLYWLNLIFGLLLFLIFNLSVPLIATYFSNTNIISILRVFSLYFLIAPFGQQFQSLLQKELKFKHLAHFDIASALIFSFTCIYTAHLGYGAISIVFGQISGLITRVIFLNLFCLSKYRPIFILKISSIKKYLVFGTYQIGEKSMNYFIGNLDFLVVGRLFGSFDLGLYTLASNLILKPSIVINPIINKVTFPLLARIESDSEKLKSFFIDIVNYVAVVNFPIIIGIAAVSRNLILNFYGPDWSKSIPIIYALLIAALFKTLINPLGSLILAKKRPDLGFKWNLILIFVQTPVLILGGTYGGIIGIALSFSTLMVLYYILSYFVFVERFLGKCWSEYTRNIFDIGLIAASMGLTVWFVGITPISSMTNLLILQIATGAIIYIISIRYIKSDVYYSLKDIFIK